MNCGAAAAKKAIMTMVDDMREMCIRDRCTGARILLESLKREGVDLFFGYPGGAVIDIYDELSNHPDLRHILVRHEQGAVHAADGYARACGKVGVCLATSGPGATNTVTGIATAYSDSIPMVIFTGDVYKRQVHGPRGRRYRRDRGRIGTFRTRYVARRIRPLCQPDPPVFILP